MAKNPLVDSRDVRFVLFEQFEVDKLNGYPRYADFDRDVMEDSLNLAETVAVDQIYPTLGISDKEGAQYIPETKEVKVPEAFREPYRAYVEAGFNALRFPPEEGGVGMPFSVNVACKEYLAAANTSFGFFPGLAEGVADMIIQFGNQEQKDTYVPNLLSGKWSGTMCLTEPEAGSDVGALKTKAVKQPDGTYLLSGQKIFITGCEHDLAENIIHAVLARVEGDPPGTKGISIFLVPKYLVNDDGSTGKRNDIECAGLEHKMGINASATGTLAIGDNGKCVGFMLGEQCKGMNVMFLMMNEARISVGMQGLAISSTAYMHAVTYARNRVQGPHVTKMMDKDPQSVAIINHPDVRRMLLWMKSYIEGMRMIAYYLAYNLDLEHVLGKEEAKEANALVELLTPILKAGNSDMSWLITAEAMQVYGGYGYTREYPVEQFARDSKIGSIYEGTNGIQAMDLTMRKILMNDGQFNYKTWRKRVNKTADDARGIVEDKYIGLVETSVNKLDEIIGVMLEQVSAGKFLHIFSNATPLEKIMFDITIGWMHLWSLTICLPKMKELVGDAKGEEREKILEQNNEAAFYAGKVISSQFWLGTELTKTFGKIQSFMFGDTSVIKSSGHIFTGALDE